MQLNNLSSSKGLRSSRKRVGRGIAGGGGKTCGRGSKGQKSRQGTRKFTRGFEGGQVPLFRRMPRLRGFRSPNRTEYQPVNLSSLDKAFNDGDTIDNAKLVAKNLVSKISQPVKILGMGEISKKLIIKTDAASKSAIEKIEKAGGKVEVAEVKTEDKKKSSKKEEKKVVASEKK